MRLCTALFLYYLFLLIPTAERPSKALLASLLPDLFGKAECSHGILKRLCEFELEISDTERFLRIRAQLSCEQSK